MAGNSFRRARRDGRENLDFRFVIDVFDLVDWFGDGILGFDPDAGCAARGFAEVWILDELHEESVGLRNITAGQVVWFRIRLFAQQKVQQPVMSHSGYLP